jgi:phospholipid-binding lipoprotein MlaA
MTGARPVRARLAAAALNVALVAACTTSAPDVSGTQTPAIEGGGDASAQRSLIAVDDPWEGLNRRIYKFNAQADRFILLPIVDVYTFVVPLVLRDRVSDFFANIGSLVTFANLVLQLKLPEAGKTALRFGFNTLFGMFGLVDIATAAGMPRYQEDFGQTLGYWGIGGGRYLVLPFLGPSNVRDTAGTATDTAAFAVIDPFGASSLQADYPPVLAADAVNSRYIQPFRYYESGSPFEYDLVRFLYTKKRDVEIGETVTGRNPFTPEAREEGPGVNDKGAP